MSPRWWSSFKYELETPDLGSRQHRADFGCHPVRFDYDTERHGSTFGLCSLNVFASFFYEGLEIGSSLINGFSYQAAGITRNVFCVELAQIVVENWDQDGFDQRANTGGGHASCASAR